VQRERVWRPSQHIAGYLKTTKRRKCKRQATHPLHLMARIKQNRLQWGYYTYTILTSIGVDHISTETAAEPGLVVEAQLVTLVTFAILAERVATHAPRYDLRVILERLQSTKCVILHQIKDGASNENVNKKEQIHFISIATPCLSHAVIVSKRLNLW